MDFRVNTNARSSSQRNFMRAVVMIRELDAAMNETKKSALYTSRLWSSGPYSTKVLRKMYNPRGPYSRIAPHPPANPALINIQTNDFRDKWDATRYGQNILQKTGVAIYNFSAHAKYMNGLATKRMMARPIIAKMASIEVPKFVARLRKVVQMVMKVR